MNAIKLENVSKDFEGLSVLANLTLEINAGEFIGFLGPSGCGKSTLLSLISGLSTPSQGQITNTFSKKNTSFVFQEASLMPWQTVEKNISLPLELLGKNKQEITIEVAKKLTMFHLENYANYYPRQLSGGMKMRTSLARALVSNPQLLLMDEPFASLDELLREKCANEVLEISKHQNLTSILVTHSIPEAVYLCDKIYVLSHKPSKIIEVIELKKELPQEKTPAFRGMKKFNTLCENIRAIL
ncbi:MAG: ABC transporter ATP-binding protein [Bdellovibrionota bacterium]